MTKADILAGLRMRPVAFEVNGLKLFLKPWTAAYRASFFVWRKDHATADGLMERLAYTSVCDEAGNLLFDEADLPALSECFGAALQAIAERVIQLNGLGEGEAGKAPSTAGPN